MKSELNLISDYVNFYAKQIGCKILIPYISIKLKLLFFIITFNFV